MGKLDGKVAVITGGSTGMALAGAKLFVEEGAHVFIQARRQEALDDAVKLIGRNVTAVQGDAAELDDLDRLYDTVKREKGSIDVLWASASRRYRERGRDLLGSAAGAAGHEVMRAPTDDLHQRFGFPPLLLGDLHGRQGEFGGGADLIGPVHRLEGDRSVVDHASGGDAGAQFGGQEPARFLAVDEAPRLPAA
ncbi:SDR family NAD(P)-dependent oxidoreductase [Streptomyces albicerus]|uniref:SDR family NAD(P)-dependent oxidoreductase n=1 Tax=Streptomyces albicerus TaxID=2569859 RepID=UPI00298D93E8|nr:SDR family NAD(P)-dependent oxidoreductase [Streptomyces albicerus]